MKDNTKTKKQLIDELTELRSQNAALEKSESSGKYRLLVENIRDIIYELDSQGVVLYISPAVRDILGYDLPEIEGKNFIELAHKDDLNRMTEWFSELRKGIEQPSEYRVSNKSGEFRWARTNARPIMEEGLFKGARGILIDVTEQRRAEKALKESEEKYRELVKYAPAGIYEVDYETGLFKSVNDVMCEYTGYTRDELLNTNLYNLLTEESQKLMRERFEKLSAGEKMPQTFEYCIRTKGGEILWALLNARYIYEEGKLKGATGIIYNITDRKRAEEALRESEETYRLVVDNMADVISVMDMNLRFTYVSPSVMHMRGYTAEEAVAQTFEQIMTPESLQIITKVFEEEMKLEASGTADPGRNRIMELEEYRKDGSIVWIENSLSYLRDKAQKPIGIISLSRDITERKESEDKIKKQTDAMDAAIDGIAILNKDEEYIYLNQAHARIYGYENAGELIVKSWRTLYDSDQLQRFDAEIMPKFSKKEFWQGETLGMKKDGSKFPQEISLTALDGGGLICIVHDITKRKQAAAVLRESEERYRVLFEGSTPGILVTDIETGRFIDANLSICRMLGYSKAELLKLSIADIHPKEIHENVMQQLDFHAQGGQSVPGKISCLRKDGSFFYAEIIGATTIFNGKLCAVGFFMDITEREQAAEKIQQTLESLSKAVTTTIQVMVSAVEARDPYTSGHQLRVADIARAIATEMGLSQKKIDGIRMAGSIHDIGKLSIPAEILSKPGKLSEIEFSLIKEHARKGYEMIKDVESPWPLAQIVYQHHERMDGSGYPRNLKEDEILMEARIMAVADVVESMASYRPYRPALGIEAALKEIEKNRGVFYDNAVADTCLRLFREKGFKLETV